MSELGSNQKDFIENADGSRLLDHKGQPISVDKFLSTKPLRSEVSTRKGPGGMKLSYMGGDVITKTLNDAFGYDGWSLEVKDKTQLDPIKDDKGRYHVAFTATVRITHRRTGAFREDCGAGDAIDKSLASASGNALKGAVTDAMKRAARHFGEKLGNSLYHDDFNVNKAPTNLKDACDMLDIERANGRFGFAKDRKIPTQTQASSNAAAAASTNMSQTNNNAAKVVGGGGVQNAHNYTKPTGPPLYVGGCVAQQQTPRTTMTSKVSNQPKTQPKVTNNTNNNASSKASYVTPHHHGMNPNNNSNKSTSSGIPPPPHRPTTAKTAAALSAKENENANISQTAKLHHQQQHAPPPKTGGLNLPKRPGTSRGVVNNPGADDAMKAFYGNDMAATNTTNSAAPSMFASSGGMSQALMMEQQQQQQSLSSSLKRKSDGLDHNPNAIKKNPYSQA